MSKVCNKLHQFFERFGREPSSFEKSKISLNGVYLLYEKGEKGHGSDRIVHVGTHTGTDQLPSRLEEHFFIENKDRSILRKHIGGAILNKNNDRYLETWYLIFKKLKDEYLQATNEKKQNEVEKSVTGYLKEKCTFVIFPEKEKKKRLELKSKIISTISHCEECGPSFKWMGLHSPKDKIRLSGLWQIQHLYKKQFSENEIEIFIKKYS